LSEKPPPDYAEGCLEEESFVWMVDGALAFELVGLEIVDVLPVVVLVVGLKALFPIEDYQSQAAKEEWYCCWYSIHWKANAWKGCGGC